jgi:hypothetical protein
VRKKLQGRVRGAAGDLPAEADERLAAASREAMLTPLPHNQPLALPLAEREGFPATSAAAF